MSIEPEGFTDFSGKCTYNQSRKGRCLVNTRRKLGLIFVLVTAVSLVFSTTALAGNGKGDGHHRHSTSHWTISEVPFSTTLVADGITKDAITGTLLDNGQPVVGQSVVGAIHLVSDCSDDYLSITKTTDSGGNYIWHVTAGVDATGSFYVQTTADGNSPGQHAKSACIKITTVPPVVIVPPQQPNAVAYCYDASSYVMITPAYFGWLISPPGPGSSAAEHWTTGYMASWLAGVGFYCGPGTPTGQYVDTTGFPISAAGYASMVGTYGLNTVDIRAVNGVNDAVAEAYPVVTTP